MQLLGKVAIVSGASSGGGATFATLLFATLWLNRRRRRN